VTEELAFDERGRDGRTVHLDERARAPQARRVDRARDELLAGPGLAEDEDGRVGGCDLLDLLENPQQCFARAQDVVEAAEGGELLAEVLGLDGERADAALRLEPLVHVPEDQGVEDLAVEVVVQAVDRADSALPGGVAVEVAA